MPGLTLYKSNRMEALADALADVMLSPLASPFLPETIVVQSLGMRRWLSLRLAEKQGICTNCSFPFAKQFVDEVFTAVLGQPTPTVFSDRAALTWRIMKVLPELSSRKDFEAVANYVTGHNADLKLFQLSEKIASVFDQYVVFRPKMVLEWEKGQGDDWQAVLWRALIKGGHSEHQAAQAEALAARLAQAESLGQLPTRVSIFGISSLPPFYVQLFGALAKQMEVHVFLLDPTDQLWAHIISEAEEDKIRRKLKNPQLTTGELHADDRNSLLASLGKSGRDFQNLMLELEPVETKTFYVSPNNVEMDSGNSTSPGDTVLSSLQGDIFHLRDPEVKHVIDAEDRSIQVHSCHSPMREMEVLHDQLLALFEQNPSLTPKDIVVMMPEVKTYAPFIQAVFGSPEKPFQYIPFTIADRGLRAENGLADTFLRILDVGRSRFGVGNVLAILETPAVQHRFGLTESDMDTIRTWVEQVGIRWGIDGAHREKLELPALEQNTWRAGLRRMLLGYALPAREDKLFGGVLPYDDVEGHLAGILGNVAEFAERLFALAEHIPTPRTLSDWQKFSFQVVETFFRADERSENELCVLRESLATLSTTAELAEFSGEVPADVMFAYLGRLLDSEESSGGFLMGHVTFCALRPMRSVPFQVVCLAGMNDASFPRPQRNLGFDKIAEKPQVGDRSNRHEDRYLFLEAILSARQVFYVSYVGQSVRDNAVLPPSVLVSELLDYLERGFEVPRDGNEQPSMEEWLVTKHRLQAFSPAYFQNDSKLWSYSVENCAASFTTLKDRKSPAVFLDKPLAEPESEWRKVELDALARFFCNPAEFLVRTRLGIHLREAKVLADEREIVELDPLTRHDLRAFFAEKNLAGVGESQAFDLVRASGRAPMGKIGDCYSRYFAEEIEEFAAAVQAHTQESPQQLAIHEKLGAWEILGSLNNVYPQHLLRARCADIKAKDIVRAWIQHVAINLVRPGTTSVLIGLKSKMLFQAPANSAAILERLLQSYWAGLRIPLRFFPETSLKFAERKLRATSSHKDSPRVAAEKLWFGNDFGVGEIEDAYYRLCFDQVENPLDAEWERLALEICQPIFGHTREEDL